MDLGFELQGDFELLACVEIEEAACQTIRTNAEQGHFTGNPIVFCRDLFDLTPEELMGKVGLQPGELDLLVGGPPCQSLARRDGGSPFKIAEARCSGATWTSSRP